MDRATFLRSFTVFLIAALMAGCGGGGGGGGGGKPDGGAPAVAASKIFVGDSGNGAIGSSPNSNPSAGTVTVERTIFGANTLLDTNLFDFALDATNDRLYVSDLRSILVFNGASTATGNVAPSRTVSVLGGGLGSFNGGLYLDTLGNRLYAGANIVIGTKDIQVFDSASTASFAAPTRTITFSSNGILDIAVDTTRDILYVYNVDAGGFNQISVFDSASSRNGAVVPDRTISFNDSGGSGPVGIFIDAANDRLYVPRNGGTIAVFDVVHTASGSVTTTAVPTRTIDLRPTTSGYSMVFVELSADRLYALDPGGVNIIANASTVSGTPLAFIRAIAPAGSLFQTVVVKP